MKGKKSTILDRQLVAAPMLARVSKLHLFIVSLSFFCFLSWSIDASAAWVKRYNGPGNGDDGAHAIAVDGSGNVYVTGSSTGIDSGYDYATIKYDTNGNRKWMQRYNGPAHMFDSAGAIAVDSSGNVYVTGASAGVTSDLDYATIKYDTNGNRKWVQRYVGPGGSDVARAIAVDSKGNVYVTGYSRGTTSGDDYATVKYDTNGNRKWVQRYNGPGGGFDYAVAIAVDGSGNVYVTGQSTGTSSGSDYATVKYDTNGNRKWVRRYNGPVSGFDAASAIAVDGGGNVYVTGSSTGTTRNGDYATIKYDTNGGQKWVKRYVGPGSFDMASAIAVDGSGNVYVTGESAAVDPVDHDYATIKYDTNGNQKWAKRYDGPGNGYDSASDIAVDKSGNVYVMGVTTITNSDLDYATIKYDAGGSRKWVKRYDGPANDFDMPSAIAVHSNGNVYVTGISRGTTSGNDYATVKCDTNGK